MKNRILKLLLLSLYVFPVKAQTSLSLSMEHLLCDTLLQTSDVSVAVFDLDTQQMLYRHRDRKLCRPASVQKLITVITALSCLGNDYTFDTRLCYDGTLYSDSLLQGNLYVVGGFDPLFSDADLRKMVQMLPMQGIRRISDTLFADVSLTDSLYWGSGWSWDDTPYSYQPYLSPLMLNEGCVDVTVSPAQPGMPPLVECFPLSSFYSMENRAVSFVPEAGKLAVSRNWLQNGNILSVTGNCTQTVKEKVNIYRSQDFFLSTFSERLDSLHIRYGATAFGRLPCDALPLYICRRPIGEVIGLALGESDNLCAEALYYHLAAQNGRRQVGGDDAALVVDSFIAARFSAVPAYRMVDGSGLSLYNYISADLMIRFLNYAYQTPDIYRILLDHLPQSGVRGTLNGRMGKRLTYGKVYAKTGTVSGVSTLSGYVRAKNGHTLAFAVFNQHILQSTAARTWQNRLCEILCNFSE